MRQYQPYFDLREMDTVKVLPLARRTVHRDSRSQRLVHRHSDDPWLGYGAR